MNKLCQKQQLQQCRCALKRSIQYWIAASFRPQCPPYMLLDMRSVCKFTLKFERSLSSMPQRQLPPTPQQQQESFEARTRQCSLHLRLRTPTPYACSCRLHKSLLQLMLTLSVARPSLGPQLYRASRPAPYDRSQQG